MSPLRRRVRGSMYVEYLLVVGAVALVSVAAMVSFNGQLKDQFRKEVRAVGAKSGGGR